MRTFIVGINGNKSVHVFGTIMDLTQEGHLIILQTDEESESIVAIFKSWNCCMASDSLTSSSHVDNLDE